MILIIGNGYCNFIVLFIGIHHWQLHHQTIGAVQLVPRNVFHLLHMIVIQSIRDACVFLLTQTMDNFVFKVIHDLIGRGYKNGLMCLSNVNLQ